MNGRGEMCHTGLFPEETIVSVPLMQLSLGEMTVIGNELALRWSDGGETYISLELLRKRCPCAQCAGETDLLGAVYKGENARFRPASFELKRCAVVGGYGIQPEWMDGHGSGIFSFNYLKLLGSDAK
jgi:DUF971 family protein